MDKEDRAEGSVCGGEGSDLGVGVGGGGEGVRQSHQLQPLFHVNGGFWHQRPGTGTTSPAPCFYAPPTSKIPHHHTTSPIQWGPIQNWGWGIKGGKRTWHKQRGGEMEQGCRIWK